MSINLLDGYRDLVPHIGHELACAGYGEHPDNVAIECITCSSTVIDFNYRAPRSKANAGEVKS